MERGALANGGLGPDATAVAAHEHDCGNVYDVEIAAACLRLFREQGFQLQP